MWELPRVHQQSVDVYAASWNSAIDALDPTDYPYLHALRSDLITAAFTTSSNMGSVSSWSRCAHRPGEATPAPCDKHTSPADVVQRVQPLVQLHHPSSRLRVGPEVVRLSRSQDPGPTRMRPQMPHPGAA